LEKEEESQYDIFICYYTRSGKNFAEHLKNGLFDVGIKAFVASQDISKTVKYGTQEWRNIIDKNILEAEKFLLIMTLGYNTREEVIREYSFAIDSKKDTIYCRHNELPSSQLTIKIKNKEMNLSDIEYISFEDEEDLLRKTGAELFGVKVIRKYNYMEKINYLINNEGKHLKSDVNPTIEVVISPKSDLGDWLYPDKDNRSLVSIAPSFIQTRVTREYFYGDTPKGEYLRVYKDGYFYFISKLFSGDKYYYIDHILKDIIEIFVCAVRIMKHKKINKEHLLYIILRYMNNGKFKFFGIGHNLYNFPQNKISDTFKYSFNPSNKWCELKNLLTSLYREICLDLGIYTITNKIINRKIWNIMLLTPSINTNYTTQKINAINLDEFCFTEEEKKKLFGW